MKSKDFQWNIVSAISNACHAGGKMVEYYELDGCMSEDVFGLLELQVAVNSAISILSISIVPNLLEETQVANDISFPLTCMDVNSGTGYLLEESFSTIPKVDIKLSTNVTSQGIILYVCKTLVLLYSPMKV